MRFAGIALALLGACTDFAGPGGSAASVILPGDVTVRGPEGYCIDTRISRPSAGFAALADCALISDVGTSPRIEGLITVQVGAAGTASVAGAEQELGNLLRSAQGLALLASDGQAASVRLDTVEIERGMVIVHFTDTSAPIAPGLEQLEWRAFFDIGDRLTTVGVRGFARDPISRRDGLRLLNQAVDTLRAANSAVSGASAGG